MSIRELAIAGGRLGLREVDRVWAALALGFLGLALGLPEQAGESAAFIAESALGIAPFLIGSILVAAYAKASGAENLIARAFSGNAVRMIIFAALVGALSPFCSCGVIPLVAALLGMGVPLPAVMAFWLASPVMDPAMFVLTSGVLSVEFAIAKTFAAIALGLFGGFTILALQRAGRLQDALRVQTSGSCASKKVGNGGPIIWFFWDKAERRALFQKDARHNALFLGKWLLLAFLLESLMLAYVPAETVAGAIGDGGFGTVALASLVGVPAYLNGYAALPLVGGLIEQGMAPGAALAFLVAGGVTSLPAAIAVYALARVPVFLVYLAVALAGSITMGIVLGPLL